MLDALQYSWWSVLDDHGNVVPNVSWPFDQQQLKDTVCGHCIFQQRPEPFGLEADLERMPGLPIDLPPSGVPTFGSKAQGCGDYVISS